MTFATPTRPVLRYHGGKWQLAPWIISYFPEHKIYVEPFGGAASVLLRKPRSYSEVYNDLDGEVVNLFRVLRNPSQARELVRLVKLTPFAREEFELSYITAGDPIEQARRTLVRSWQGFHGRAIAGSNTGFRTGIRLTGGTASHNWCDLPQSFIQVMERFRGVVIENQPAVNVIAAYDSDATLFYVDPPYVHDTRGKSARYAHEMNDDDHRELAAPLHTVRGMVIISGYACDLYDKELYPGWRRIERTTHADGAHDRVEVLWISPSAVRQPTLFQEEQP